MTTRRRNGKVEVTRATTMHQITTNSTRDVSEFEWVEGNGSGGEVVGVRTVDEKEMDYSVVNRSIGNGRYYKSHYSFHYLKHHFLFLQLALLMLTSSSFHFQASDCAPVVAMVTANTASLTNSRPPTSLAKSDDGKVPTLFGEHTSTSGSDSGIDTVKLDAPNNKPIEPLELANRPSNQEQELAEEDSILVILAANKLAQTSSANESPSSIRRLTKRSGISDQRLAEIQMIRALKKQLERAATKMANSGLNSAGQEASSR